MTEHRARPGDPPRTDAPSHRGTAVRTGTWAARAGARTAEAGRRAGTLNVRVAEKARAD
ncbi:hypothetical protein [Nocardia abscessus]|uniref:hypothetical protein n=1 Tax=Nocardia abscessus TaxID=120957 RepID=UPI0024564A8D|nr:hypothetical protein [Nocardia abscessus]